MLYFFYCLYYSTRLRFFCGLLLLLMVNYGSSSLFWKENISKKVDFLSLFKVYVNDCCWLSFYYGFDIISILSAIDLEKLFPSSHMFDWKKFGLYCSWKLLKNVNSWSNELWSKEKWLSSPSSNPPAKLKPNSNPPFILAF